MAIFPGISDIHIIGHKHKHKRMPHATIGGGADDGDTSPRYLPVECELLSVKQYITLNNYLTPAPPLARSRNG